MKIFRVDVRAEGDQYHIGVFGRSKKGSVVSNHARIYGEAFIVDMIKELIKGVKEHDVPNSNKD